MVQVEEMTSVLRGPPTETFRFKCMSKFSGLRPILKGLRLKANIFAWKAIPRSWLQSMSSYSAYVQSNMKKQAHLYSHVEVQPSWTRFELKDVLSI